MNTPYDVNLPIEVLFDQVKDGIDYADARGNPKTTEQIVMTGQQLIQETGMFTYDLKAWKRLPPTEKTWARFKQDFSTAHQELRENSPVVQGMFAQANAVQRDSDITEAMANFASAITSNKTTMETLTTTVQRLTAELPSINAQLVTALAANTTLTAIVSVAVRNHPRGRGGGRGRLVLSRIGGPTGRYYCWLCGDHYYHTSKQY